jgi:hypothetical protein
MKTIETVFGLGFKYLIAQSIYSAYFHYKERRRKLRRVEIRVNARFYAGGGLTEEMVVADRETHPSAMKPSYGWGTCH